MKTKKENKRRFSGLIRQMKRDKYHVILVNLAIKDEFKKECAKEGFEMSEGSTVGDKIVLFER